jgi:hypothetical protein
MRVLSAFRFVPPLPSKVFAVTSTEEKPKTKAHNLQRLTPSTKADTLQILGGHDGGLVADRLPHLLPTCFSHQVDSGMFRLGRNWASI